VEFLETGDKIKRERYTQTWKQLKQRIRRVRQKCKTN
jgi:hypothetical protein